MRAVLRATGGGQRTNHHAPVMVTTPHLDLGHVAATTPTTALLTANSTSEGALRQRLDEFTRDQFSR